MSKRIKTDSPPLPRPAGRLLLRPRVWAGLLFLLALGFGAHFMWKRGAPVIARHPQYRLTADRIHITPAPPWIRTNLKDQVLREAGLTTLSVLDDWQTLSRRIEDAFEFHPWIESVDQIKKGLPASLEVSLSYRRPVAAVESGDANGISFLPVDRNAVRLPEGDLTDTELRYLPRIAGVTGRPLVGDVWNDQRVVGGAKLAAALRDDWQKLRLVEIIAVLPASANQAHPSYTFNIITKGGTRVVWGAAPGMEVALGESAFDQKRQRLMEYASQHGQLGKATGPEEIDVRREIVVKPRTARGKAKSKVK